MELAPTTQQSATSSFNDEYMSSLRPPYSLHFEVLKRMVVDGSDMDMEVLTQSVAKRIRQINRSFDGFTTVGSIRFTQYHVVNLRAALASIVEPLKFNDPSYNEFMESFYIAVEPFLGFPSKTAKERGDMKKAVIGSFGLFLSVMGKRESGSNIPGKPHRGNDEYKKMYKDRGYTWDTYLGYVNTKSPLYKQLAGVSPEGYLDEKPLTPEVFEAFACPWSVSDGDELDDMLSSVNESNKDKILGWNGSLRKYGKFATKGVRTWDRDRLRTAVLEKLGGVPPMLSVVTGKPEHSLIPLPNFNADRVYEWSNGQRISVGICQPLSYFELVYRKVFGTVRYSIDFFCLNNGDQREMVKRFVERYTGQLVGYISCDMAKQVIRGNNGLALTPLDLGTFHSTVSSILDESKIRAPLAPVPISIPLPSTFLPPPSTVSLLPPSSAVPAQVATSPALQAAEDMVPDALMNFLLANGAPRDRVLDLFRRRDPTLLDTYNKVIMVLMKREIQELGFSILQLVNATLEQVKQAVRQAYLRKWIFDVLLSQVPSGRESAHLLTNVSNTQILEMAAQTGINFNTVMPQPTEPRMYPSYESLGGNLISHRGAPGVKSPQLVAKIETSLNTVPTTHTDIVLANWLAKNAGIDIKVLAQVYTEAKGRGGEPAARASMLDLVRKTYMDKGSTEAEIDRLNGTWEDTSLLP